MSSNFLETGNIFFPVESNITSCNFPQGFLHITHTLLSKGWVFDLVVQLSLCSRCLATKDGLPAFLSLIEGSYLNRIRITFFSSLYFLNVRYTLITWTMVLCTLVKQFSSCNTFSTCIEFCQLTVFVVMSFSSSNQQLLKSIRWRIQNKCIVLGIFIIETNYTIIHLALSMISLYFYFILFSCKKYQHSIKHSNY